MDEILFKITVEDMRGWVRVFLESGEPTGELARFLSRTLTSWMVSHPELQVRIIVPISHDGDTAELHAWYDPVSFAAPILKATPELWN